MLAEIELVKTEKNDEVEELTNKLKTIITQQISRGLANNNEDIAYNYRGMLGAIEEFETNWERFVKECEELETVPEFVAEEKAYRDEQRGMDNAKYSK